MSQELKFHDQSLLNAVKASSQQLDNFQQKLDQATADIKSLEKYLQSTGLCLDLSVDVSAPPYHAIGWDKVGDAWRLVGYFWDDHDRCARPLAESSARLRLACQPFLPQLVKQITETLTSLEAPIRNDLPF